MRLTTELSRIGSGCNMLTVFTAKNISLQSSQKYMCIFGFNSQLIVSLQLFKAVTFKGGQENRVS